MVSINNKRLAKNTFFLYVRMVFVLAITLYTSRAILEILGVVDYGIYNVVAGFVSFFSFLNVTLSSSMQRFYNYEGTQRGEQGIQDVYNTGLIIHVVIMIACFLIMESIGLWYVNSIMNIPESRMYAANFLFQTCIFSLLVLILQIPFVGIILAKESMDYYAIVSIFDVLLQLMAVLVIPCLDFDKLVLYGLFLLFISLIKFCAYYFYSKAKYKELKFQIARDKTLLKSILSFSGWNLLGTFAYMLRDQGVNMLLNVFFGPIVNAARGISFQIKAALSSFSGNITTAFRPQIVNSYASHNFYHTKRLMYTESKFCFALIAILSLPVLLEVNVVLKIWLGDNIPTHANLFTVLVLLDLFVGIFNQPCNQIVWAIGRLKHYQIANTCVNIGLIPACWIFLFLGFPASSAFVVTILFSIVNQIVCVVVMNTMFKIGLFDYFFRVILPCVLSVALLFFLLYMVRSLTGESWKGLLFIFITEILFSIPIFYAVLLDKEERAMGKRLVINGIHKVQIWRKYQ